MSAVYTSLERVVQSYVQAMLTSGSDTGWYQFIGFSFDTLSLELRIAQST